MQQAMCLREDGLPVLDLRRDRGAEEWGLGQFDRPRHSTRQGRVVNMGGLVGSSSFRSGPASQVPHSKRATTSGIGPDKHGFRSPQERCEPSCTRSSPEASAKPVRQTLNPRTRRRVSDARPTHPQPDSSALQSEARNLEVEFDRYPGKDAP